MTRKETIMWLDSLKKDIGQPQHQALWHYAESIDVAIKALSEQKTGKWKYLHGSIGSYMTISCPFCGETFNDVAEWKYNYCPNCGAYMKGENK